MLNNSIYTHPCAEKGPRQNMKFSLCLFKKINCLCKCPFLFRVSLFSGPIQPPVHSEMKNSRPKEKKDFSCYAKLYS